MHKINFGGRFIVKCFDKNGVFKWEDVAENIVVNEGLQHNLDILFNSATTGNDPIDPWYIGLINDDTSTALVAGDTLASHAGWTENTNYTGDRKAFDGVRSSQTVSNSASKASFTVTSDSQIISGAFLCSASTGTSGTLLSEAMFTGGDKSADTDDVLEVQYDFTAADDGA